MAKTVKEKSPGPETPEGAAKHWGMELASARKEERFKDWRELGEKIDKRFRDERDEKSSRLKKLNLFSSDVKTERAIVYGRVPQVAVDRKYADAEDDVARVAGIMLERTLNCDIQRDDDTFKEAAGNSLSDYQLPGLGCMVVRYEMEEEEVEGQYAPAEEGAEPVPLTRKASEDAPVDYMHWEDLLWSPARVWNELRWIGFHAEISKKQVAKKFGDDVAELIPYESDRKPGSREKRAESTPRSRAGLWQIWDKESKSVYFVVEGYKRVLTPEGLPPEDVNPDGSIKDPLGVPGFWPCAKFMLSNPTTSSLVPVPDFYLAQDLYYEVDATTTKIDILVEAVKVAGAYDASAPALQNLLKSKGNVLVPVENWPGFTEKGGMQGAIAWWPLEQVIVALQGLREHRREDMDLLFQVTGRSDLMRGQATAAGATAKEQGIKASFGSVRLQAQQDEFARFCSDTQRIRAHVIARHFDIETIIKRSNIEFTDDGKDLQLVRAAAELLKSRVADYRVEVKPESVSLADFASQRQESMEVLGGIASYFQAATPLAQAFPGAAPLIGKILQWAVSRIRGAATMEGILDKFVKEAEVAAKQPQQQKPDPKMQVEQMKLQAAQMKGQFDIQKEQAKHQNKLVEIQAETAAHDQQEQSQAMWNTKEALQKGVIQRALKPPEAPKPGGLPR